MKKFKNLFNAVLIFVALFVCEGYYNDAFDTSENISKIEVVDYESLIYTTSDTPLIEYGFLAAIGGLGGIASGLLSGITGGGAGGLGGILSGILGGGSGGSGGSAASPVQPVAPQSSGMDTTTIMMIIGGAVAVLMAFFFISKK